MKTTSSIYENTKVFGSTDKYDDAEHRVQTMLEIIEGVKLPKKSRVLDVGCGTGHLTSLIKDLHPHSEVCGTDVSRTAIALGKKKYPQVELHVSDSEKELPFADNSFDLIVSGEHIAHIYNTDLYISELKRVLKPRGVLILTTPNLVSWLNRILVLAGRNPFFSEPLLATTIPILNIAGKSFPDKDLPPSGHVRLFNRDMLTKVFAAYGMSVEKTVGVSSLNHPAIKSIDLLFSHIPDLASGIIVIAKKNKS